MKNALILHGVENDSSGNWFPWLKKELEEKGYKVWVPDLPNSQEPVLKDWLSHICSRKDWIFNSGSTIIGHSAGATFALRIIENLPEGIKVDKAILVAGPAQLGSLKWTHKYKRSLLEKPLSWEKIKRSCKKFVFFASDNDQYECGITQARIFQKHLGGQITLKPGESHFNLETGEKYLKFSELLEHLT